MRKSKTRPKFAKRHLKSIWESVPIFMIYELDKSRAKFNNLKEEWGLLEDKIEHTFISKHTI